MYIKLAVRNVKRQMSNYLIYFMTVALTVALMFAVNNVTYSEQLREQALYSQSLRSSLTGITLFLSLLVSFVLSYATSFMLKLRKREFGTYLTLGMTRGNILRIFLGETVVMCGAALAVGIAAGLFFYQCVMFLLMRLMELEFTFSPYSVSGLLMTVCVVAAVFLTSSLASALYLSKVSIYRLLHAEKKAEKDVRRPGLWILLALLALALMIAGGCGLFDEIRGMALSYNDDVPRLMRCIVLFLASLVVLHAALARGLVGLLLKCRRFAGRGTNTFVLRQLGATLKSNSVMLGVLAALLSFAVIGSNLSFNNKAVSEAALRRDFPYDIMYAGNLAGSGDELFAENDPALSRAEAEQKIEQYADIKAVHPYSLYTNGEGYFYGFTQYGSDGMLDYYMKESDFNGFITPLGYEPVHLEHQYFVVANEAQMNQIDWSQTKLSLDGVDYRYVDAAQRDCRLFQYIQFFVVVPDEAVERMTEAEQFATYELEPGSYTMESLRALERELTFTVAEEYMEQTFEFEQCNYYFQAFERQERNQDVALYVLSMLYIAATFLLMAIAILALKTLSALAEDRKRYQILFRLGADRREQCRALRCQTFAFFFLPYTVPLLLGIPTAYVFAEMMRLIDFADYAGTAWKIAAAVAGVMTLLYVLYYAATYQIAKRAVMESL